MRKLLFLITMLAIGFSNTWAQDLITMRDGQQIQSKIIYIDSNEVQYQLFKSTDNKVFTVKTDQLESIKFENGVIQTFGAPSSNKTNDQQTKDQKTKQDVVSSNVANAALTEDDIREYTFSAATYFADFDAIDKGCYGVFSHNLKDRKIGMSIAFPIANWGISKNKYSDVFGGAIGANYCYGINDRMCAFAPLMFYGYGYQVAEADKNGKTKDKDKFGWGFITSPSILYKVGHLAITVGPNFIWTKSSSKLSTGFQVGIGYAWK